MHHLLADLARKTTPANHRLLILRWIEGRPLAEVAQTLNLSEKQVTYRQQRLFRKLRAALAVYRGEPFAATAPSSQDSHSNSTPRPLVVPASAGRTAQVDRQ